VLVQSTRVCQRTAGIQPVRALRRGQAAAGAQMPVPAPALPQPRAIILVMPALRTPPTVSAMPMREGATAWPSAS